MFLKIKKIPRVNWSSDKPYNFKPKFSTFFFLCFGLMLFGLGEGLLIVSFTGASPWSVLAQGISLNVNLSIGTITFLISVAVLILWIPLGQKLGMGGGGPFQNDFRNKLAYDYLNGKSDTLPLLSNCPGTAILISVPCSQHCFAIIPRPIFFFNLGEKTAEVILPILIPFFEYKFHGSAQGGHGGPSNTTPFMHLFIPLAFCLFRAFFPTKSWLLSK